MSAIQVSGLGKRYRLGRSLSPQATLRDALAGLGRALGRRLQSDGARARADEFWALRDVSFDVAPGECLGVVGRNGAGKSTLLKILSRITAPTEGRVALKGRVASLLEVGTGFHPELNGRENIVLNGSILGMSRAEISARFDQIVAFSEVEAFLDTPVKHYSSGMYTRLAFAVAAHLEAEILLVDEVLAVGDAEFQRKCLGKMEDVAHSGRTVLFVSHNMLALQRLCPRSILLEKGRLTAAGPTHEILSQYLRPASLSEYQRTEPARSDEPCFLRAGLRAEHHAKPLTTDEPIGLELEWTVPRAVPRLRAFLAVNSASGIEIFNTTPEDYSRPTPTGPGTYRALVSIPGNVLLAGNYSVTFCLWADAAIFDRHDPGFGFRVEAAPSSIYAQDDARGGIFQVRCEWLVS